MSEIYAAHIRDDGTVQTVLQHLEGTATLARSFAECFNSGDYGYFCGMLHDIGKYSKEFQKRIHGASQKVDHSSAGAKEAMNLYGEKFGKLLAYCVAGHHSGLLDYGTAASTEGTLYARLKNKLEDYSAFRKEVDLVAAQTLSMPIAPIEGNIGFSLSFFIRMIYSCLVDADFIDTETYMNNELKSRGHYHTTSYLNDVFNQYIASLVFSPTKINMRRSEIFKRCMDVSKSATDLYSLTVPTGGGKTLSSLAFALNHATVNQLERIIYVIPYTSIIEQNARVFKKALGEDDVLEHHCNYQFENADTENMQSIKERIKLASENWDVPIVITTNVQFFESLFSNRSLKCRKIHNMAKSVIIFDEAQMLPFQYLRPCLLAVSELVKNYGSTAILCTATQPSINGLLPESIQPIEIMDNPSQLYEDFKKVKVTNKGEMEDETLAGELNGLDQVLCIVSTRKHAKEIYNRLNDEHKYHLSTLMCPAHRQKALDEIRQRLKDKHPCRVISTQLIEAGVDVDFPVVYRSIAGIDSIVQSAGRCNREGNLESGNVYVFKPVSEFANAKGYLARTAKVAEMVFRKYPDPISLEAIRYYFEQLYAIEGEEALDGKNVLECFESGYRQLEFDFQTAAERFKLIDSNTYSIVIPYDEEARKLINQAQYSKFPLSLARKLQRYTVSIYEYEYKALIETAVIKTINDSYIILDNYEKNYDTSTGLVLPKTTFGEAIFI